MSDRWGGASEEIRARLESWLAEPLRQLEARTLGREDKWRASSALQKSIRRGRVAVAMEMASALLQLDPPYLTRRLPVIALEDVALGNVDAAEATIWALKNARWRKQAGGTARVLLTCVEKLASGVKDRSACDLVVAAAFDPAYEAARRKVADLGGRQLTRLAVEDPDPVVRGMACWQLTGPGRFPGGRMKQGVAEPRIEAVWSALEELGAPERVRVLARAALGGRTGVLPIGLGVVGAMAQAGTWVEPGVYEQREPIDGWPAECFDVHVHEGRRALAYFVKAAPAFTRLLRTGGVPEARLRGAAAEVLWAVETDQVDRRLAFPGSAELRRHARRGAGLTWFGLRSEFHDPAIEMMRANLALLDHARRRVLGAVPAGGGPREVVPESVRGVLHRG